MNKEVTVVKIGGNVVDNPVALADFLSDFAKLPGLKILVHGGGKEATRLSSTLGIETRMIDGRRVTDGDTLDVVTMVYAGLVNKRIVSKLQAIGCNAIGLSGADAGVIRSVRRPALPVDYGFVGDIDPSGVDGNFICNLLDQGLVPVFCAITHSTDGQLLNSNADTVASSVACAVSSLANVRLVYCFEKPGVLAVANDDTSVIPSITPDIFEALTSAGTVSGGMLPKITNALRAVGSGVGEVIIKSAANLLSPNSGTVITSC